jgi:hypothetical protein
MPPKDKPTSVNAKPNGKQRAEGKESKASEKGINWLKEAWRRSGYTMLNESAIAATAAALGLQTPAVMIAPRPAPKYGDLTSSSSSSSSSLSQSTPRTTASPRKTVASPMAVRSAAAATSSFSHHNRETPYVTG